MIRRYSQPGSMIMASRVFGQAMILQLHWKIPTGKVSINKFMLVKKGVNYFWEVLHSYLWGLF